jgi:hypothetical protein
MDAVFWGPNWHWPGDEEFFTKLKNELSRDAWILDGNYTRTIPIKWENVGWFQRLCHTRDICGLNFEKRATCGRN